MTPAEKVKKLKEYLEIVKNIAATHQNPHKRAFFSREVARTERSIAKLTQ